MPRLSCDIEARLTLNPGQDREDPQLLDELNYNLQELAYQQLEQLLGEGHLADFDWLGYSPRILGGDPEDATLQVEFGAWGWGPSVDLTQVQELKLEDGITLPSKAELSDIQVTLYPTELHQLDMIFRGQM